MVVGGRVLVPLGSRQVAGYVLEIVEQTDIPPERIRPVLAVKTIQPAFTAEQAALVRWLADRYLCTPGEALRPCLAEAGSGGVNRRWQLAGIDAVTTLLSDPTQMALLDYLRAHPGASGQQLRELFGEAGAAALDGLVRDGLIRPASGRARAQARTVAAVDLALPPTRLRDIGAALPARAVQQSQCLTWLADHPTEFTTPVAIPDLARRAGVSEATVRACVEKGWLRRMTIAVRRNPWEHVRGRQATPPALNPAQQAALDPIVAALHAHQASSFLLYGITGSGKTEVFLHAIAAALALGKQCIVLVPEISLTSQAMALYHGRFPGQVAVLHSNLSAGERFDEWARIAGGEARVVLGARSAVFAPCTELGLLIIDEEHESSYKQDNSPRYHAKAVALERGRLCQAPVVLASATPSLDSMREAELGRHTLLRLPERIEARPLPPVKLVDLRRMTLRGKNSLRAVARSHRRATGRRRADHPLSQSARLRPHAALPRLWPPGDVPALRGASHPAPA